MKLARIGLGLVAAALFLIVCGPPRRVAQTLGWRSGRSAPVYFHRLLCLILRVRIRVVGRPSPIARRLIVANHVSWLDIPVLGAIEPMTFLAKKEVGGPYLGRQAALLQGVVFVDRQRRRCIPEVNANMVRAMAAGEPVVLFAEATTSDGVRLLPFRSSHFEAAKRAGEGAVVQPVFLDYSKVAGLPATRADRSIAAWYGDEAFLPHLWRMISCGALTCEVYYGEPIPAASAANRKQLARRTERAVRALAERARSRTVLPADAEKR